MKKINRILSLCFAIALLLGAAAPAAFAAESSNAGFGISVEDGKRLCGTSEIALYSIGDTAADIEILLDGNRLSPEKLQSFTFNCTAEQVDYNNSEFQINGTPVGNVSANGLNSFQVDSSYLSGDELAIDFLPSVGTSVLDTTKVYGEYNIDDMSLSSFQIALPTGEKFTPSKIILKYPIVGKAGVTEKESSNKNSVAVGDGWSSETGMGGTTPDKPISFTLIFDLSSGDMKALADKAGSMLRVTVDTTKYADGEHTLTVKLKSGDVTRKIIFDNTPPEIITAPEKSGLIDPDSELTVSATDDGKYTLTVTVDSKPLKTSSIENFKKDGEWHTLVAVATDECGNTSVKTLEFRYTLTNGGEYLNVQRGSSVTAEDGTLIKVNELESSIDIRGQKIKVPESGKVIIRCNGTTEENGEIIYYLKSNNGGKQFLAQLSSGDTEYVTLENVGAEYTDENGCITVTAEAYTGLVSSSNTMIWITDTQYYTRFDDLLCKYEAALDYYADLYKKGEAGYLIHTGDVADEYSPEANIKAQLEAASKLHKKLEDENIPYGIVNGNHDVGQSLHDSSYFSAYFGRNRFKDQPWYRGSLNNNESHYDLITLDGYDFLLLWIGYGVEDAPVTVAWANEVLSRYPDRNAIILTHSYLDTDGTWVLNEANPASYDHSRAPEIWENIVVPNDNVVAVFCGHTNGAARTLRKVDGNRSVWEILSDYQFVEDGTDPKHVLNGMTCDGEGFIRIVSFTGQEMIQKTYSPYSGKENPFGADKDSFTVPLVLKKSESSTIIISGIAGFEVVSETPLDGQTLEISGKYIISADTYSITEGDGGYEDEVSNETPSEAAPESSSDNVEEASSNWIIWIVAAMLFVGAAVGVITVIKKRK